MKPSSIFCSFAFTVLSAIAVAGCGGGGSTPPVPSSFQSDARSVRGEYLATPTPAPRLLYAIHSGTVSVYALPLKANAKPLRELEVVPGHPSTAEAIAVDPFGKVAVATPKQLRIYWPPITSLEPSKARITVPFTPAMTAIGPSGADLVDIEFDPYDNLWLFSNLAGDITELVWPISRTSVALTDIQFGVTGTKTAGFETLVQGRFDVNSTLYVFADNSNIGGQLFKIGYPYAKPPGGFYGLNLLQAAFVDPSQFLYGPPPSLSDGAIFGQYFGQLKSTPPLKPTPPPVNVLAQFNTPLMPNGGGTLYPNITVKANVGALAADPRRDVIYTLNVADGKLNVYPMPLPRSGKPNFSLACSGGPSICNSQPEHLFTAP
jgi:hypothetical protein